MGPTPTQHPKKATNAYDEGLRRKDDGDSRALGGEKRTVSEIVKVRRQGSVRKLREVGSRS